MWRHEHTVESRDAWIESNDPRTRWECRTWREYSLAGLFPMLLPDWIPAETISNTLDRMTANLDLPWQLGPDGCDGLHWIDPRTSQQGSLQ